MMDTTIQSRATTGRGRASGAEAGIPRDEYDLLIAAALGVAVGAGLTLLLRRGGKGERGAARLARAARRGAGRVGRYGADGARWAAKHGEKLIDRVPVDEIRDSIGEYMDSARSAIDDMVTREMKGLRKAIRRQRKRLRV
jgi:hypothetical protein